MMTKLADLGFSKGVIVETIVSTYNLDGQPNAAPMGVIMQNEQEITINLYNSSLTCKNLETNKKAVINLTTDIDVFYRTAFKEANPKGNIPKEWFEKAEKVNAPKLFNADASIDVSIIGMEAISKEKTKALCKVEMVKAYKTNPQAYCRAFAAALEAIIHATRVKALINDKKEQEHVKNLLGLIENCNVVVNKVAANSHYSRIMSDLTERIELWRKSS